MTKCLAASAAAVSFLFLLSLLARADVPVPGETAAERDRRVQERDRQFLERQARMHALQQPPVPKEFPLRIEATGPPVVNQIHLPQELLAQLHAAAPSAENSPGTFPLRPATAGAALALAAAIGGLQLARNRHRLAYGSMTVGLVALSLVGVSCLPDQVVLPHGDGSVGTEPPPQAITCNEDGTAVGEVIIWTHREPEVVMTLPQEPFQKMAEPKKGGEKK